MTLKNFLAHHEPSFIYSALSPISACLPHQITLSTALPKKKCMIFTACRHSSQQLRFRGMLHLGQKCFPSVLFLQGLIKEIDHSEYLGQDNFGNKIAFLGFKILTQALAKCAAVGIPINSGTTGLRPYFGKKTLP